jgi:hypothetical protein
MDTASPWAVSLEGVVVSITLQVCEPEFCFLFRFGGSKSLMNNISPASKYLSVSHVRKVLGLQPVKDGVGNVIMKRCCQSGQAFASERWIWRPVY